MALGKDRKRINVKGGGLLKLRELDPSATAAFSEAGWLGGTTVSDKHDMVTSKDEQGLVIDHASSGEDVTLKSILKQTTIDEINLLKNADGKYYEAYYYVKLKNGNVQELNIPLCKITPGFELDHKPGERNIEIAITALAIKAATTVTRAPVAYNIDPTVNPYYVLIEGAAPGSGAPTETAGTLTTLISNIL
jgi:hypothetical protein